MPLKFWSFQVVPTSRTVKLIYQKECRTQKHESAQPFNCFSSSVKAFASLFSFASTFLKLPARFLLSSPLSVELHGIEIWLILVHFLHLRLYEYKDYSFEKRMYTIFLLLPVAFSTIFGHNVSIYRTYPYTVHVG